MTPANTAAVHKRFRAIVARVRRREAAEWARIMKLPMPEPKSWGRPRRPGAGQVSGKF